MPGYKYKGTYTGPDLFDLTAPRNNGQPEPCGTHAAYRRHLRKKEQPCQPCTTAANKYNADRRTKTQPKRQPCGTYAAYQRHKRRDEKPCPACHQALLTHWQNERTRKKEAA